jgi:hypothetical protein
MTKFEQHLSRGVTILINPSSHLCHRTMRPSRKLATSLLLLTSLAVAQEIPGKRIPSVSMSPAPLITITRGKPGTVDLHFRVDPGFHINSNTPRSEFLIPTVLKLTAPTDIVVGKVIYPPGEEMSFPFAPEEKLSVYTSVFILGVVVRPLASVVPGKYAFHGQLKYQACDKAACYPPKQLPVDFQVKVAKSSAAHGKNPAQSPHVHR